MLYGHVKLYTFKPLAFIDILDNVMYVILSIKSNLIYYTMIEQPHVAILLNIYKDRGTSRIF